MQKLDLQLKGLYTHQNPLSEVPLGALTIAKNVVLNQEGIVQTRRGFSQYGNAFSLSGSEQINNIFNYDETLLVNYASKMAYDSDDAGTWVDYSGSYVKPDLAVKIHSVQSNNNFYFTTDEGIKKLSSVTGAITQAGGIKALDGVGSTTGASGFFTTGNQVAYRIVWGIKDANNNLILGAPSQIITVVNNTGGSRDVSLTFNIPDGITTSYFYQIYRSALSGGASISPNDELGLVIEDNPTSGEISAKSVTLTDSVPDSLRGATIYTAPSQEGITQANDAPPLAADVAYFKNYVFYANTLGKQRFTLTLIAVGAPSGIVANDTLTIGGVVYTGKASENAAAGEFAVVTSGSPAENIEDTALSLIRVINTYSSNTAYYAYYLSGFNDLPGIILIEERGLGASSYVITSSNTTCWNPVLPSSGTTVSTTNEQAPNRIYISKLSQPEAVPLLNFIDIGSKDKNILRVIPLRYSVFVFKEDGVYRLTGDSISTFNVDPFDLTVILAAPESAVAFNNQVFCFTTQGVIAVSDSGSAIVSRPIETQLLKILAFPNFDTICFSIAYESDRKFIMFCQTISTDTYATQAFVYDSITKGWTNYVMSRTCGIVNSNDDKLYLGSATNGYIYKERKNFDLSDYADDQYSVTITGYSGTTVNLSSTTNAQVGYTIKQGTSQAIIDEVVDSTTLTVDQSLIWTNGAATVYTPIDVEIETVPQAADNPGILKQYREIVLIFRKANFTEMLMGMRSNYSLSNQQTPLYPITVNPWGSLPWGQGPWGGSDTDLQTIRTYVPRYKQRANWVIVNLQHETALNFFALAGIVLYYHNMSSRQR